MTVRVLVNGAFGRMGQETVAAVEADNALTLVCKADKDDDLAELIKAHQAEVVVDFTIATVAFENAK